jgi:transcriptional regulator with XRE-family HTH domain
MTLRDLSAVVGVGFAYLSRIENGRLNYGDYPSEALIARLAHGLDADEDELLLLAEKIPERLRQRVFERPDVFLRIAALPNADIDRLLESFVECGTAD